MLRLPPEVRTAVASKLVSSASRLLATAHRSRWTAAAIFRLLPHQQQPSGPRQYATVHSGEWERMWREHGRTSPETSASIIERAPNNVAFQSQVPDLNAALQATLSSLELAEAQDLLTVLYRESIRSLNRSTQKDLRQKIRSAVHNTDPLSALRQLADKRNLKPPGIKSTKPDSDAYGLDGGVNHYSESINEPLVDTKYIMETMPLPTREQYPDALEELFNGQISAALHNQSQKLKTSIQTELDFSTMRKSNSTTYFTCTVKVEIPDICNLTATGQGSNKQRAKHAAWLHVVSKMHVDESLKELFSTTEAPGDEELPDIETTGAELQLSELDEEVKKEHKDAKAEIYEYAASLGLIPVFESKPLRLKSPATRRQRMASMKARMLFQVSIYLPGREVSGSAVGKDLQTAETAAAIAFKAEAEKQQATSNEPTASRRILTLDNAKKFFDFYKRRARFDLEIEYEGQSICRENHTKARLTIDGSQLGHEVAMRRKKEAEAVVYLTAAVELANKDPDLLRDFETAMSEGAQDFRGEIWPVQASVDRQVLISMRDALLEARDAGLPDARQVLTAENPSFAEQRRRYRDSYSQEELNRVDELLRSNQERFNQDPNLEELRSKQAALPMTQYREKVLSMVSVNQYSIIVGATGSGKTTQVPQILFEDAINAGHGTSCSVICTQPRRIAATSVAQRVATERDEDLQTSVGYQVRFDAKLPRDPFGITYCTTGILLEKLKGDPDGTLDSASHICIDEVHERDLRIDFLMIVLKRAIARRQSEGKKVPKVVLMSATLDTELFATYFSVVDEDGKETSVPSLSVPGRTFAVTEKHLVSILEEMRKKHGSELDYVLSQDKPSDDYLAAEKSFSARNQVTRKDSIIDWKGEAIRSPAEAEAAKEKEEALVPVALLAATIGHICCTTHDGAILAFLPGIGEIIAAQRILERNPFGVEFSNESKFKIFPLHSTSTKEQQNEIFQPLPDGCRKIILATNIAETSVTVADVKYVVDSGKHRENRYDQLRRITKLQCVWVSKSSAKQRAGRAGRVQDGHYYALFSKERHDSLKAIGQPELLRSDLQETCLSVKAQNFNEPVASFLAQAIEPPSPEAVDAAVLNLTNIEAVTEDEELTPLGRVLSKLPVHPSLGKMIILGVIFRCLDPMITLGAAVNERALFITPIERRDEARKAHKRFAPFEKSDQLAMLEAFQELRSMKDERGIPATYAYAVSNFLHFGVFKTIDGTARQIEDILVDCGLIPESAYTQDYDYLGYGPPDLNTNATNIPLIKSLLVAGFRPNVSVKMSSTSADHRTQKESRVQIQPHSRNTEVRRTGPKHPTDSLFTYGTLAKSVTGDSLFLRDTTMVTPLMVLLFGGHLRITPEGYLEMDDWLPFNIRSVDQHFATRMILEFRKAMERVLVRAFQSLENLTQREGEFGDDKVQEGFVKSVVGILDVEREDSVEGIKQGWREAGWGERAKRNWRG